MSYIAALTEEEKTFVKGIYGFHYRTFNPKFDGVKYIYDLPDDASPTHFEIYVQACRDFCVCNTKNPGNRLPMLVAIQVRAGLVGQSTYYLTKPVLDSWEYQLKTHFADAVLDIFVGQLRYVLMREMTQDFWTRVFTSWHQKEGDDIKRFKAQADILFDAFAWSKILMLMMDGVPSGRATFQSLPKADATIATQRIEFIDYARSGHLRQLWGLAAPRSTEPLVAQPVSTSDEKTGQRQGSPSSVASQVASVVAATPARQPARVLRSGRVVQTQANQDVVIEEQEVEGTESKAEDDYNTGDPNTRMGTQQATSSSSQQSPVRGTGPILDTVSPTGLYKSSYTFLPSTSAIDSSELAVFAAAQRKEPFNHGDERSIPSRRAVAPFSPSDYRNEITYKCGQTTSVRLHHIIGPGGIPLQDLPTSLQLYAAIGHADAVPTDRKRPGKDQAIWSDDVRRLDFSEEFKLSMIKKALLPSFRRQIFPRGFKSWHPPTLDAAWLLLFRFEKALKERQAIVTATVTWGKSSASSPKTTKPVPTVGIPASSTSSVSIDERKAKSEKRSGGQKKRSPSSTKNRTKLVSVEGKPICRHFLQGKCIRNPCHYAHEPAVVQSSGKGPTEGGEKTVVANTTVLSPSSTSPSKNEFMAPIDWATFRLPADDGALRMYLSQIRLQAIESSQVWNAPVVSKDIKAAKGPFTLDKDKILAAMKSHPKQTIQQLDYLCKGNICVARLRTPLTGNTTFKVVVDSGADASMVSLRLFEAVFNTLPTIPAEVALIGATSEHSTPIKTRVCIPLVISITPPALVEHWFLVVPGLATDFMLGMDFLKRYHCSLDCTAQGIVLLVGTGKKFPVTLQSHTRPEGKQNIIRSAFMRSTTSTTSSLEEPATRKGTREGSASSTSTVESAQDEKQLSPANQEEKVFPDVEVLHKKYVKRRRRKNVSPEVDTTDSTDVEQRNRQPENRIGLLIRNIQGAATQDEFELALGQYLKGVNPNAQDILMLAALTGRRDPATSLSPSELLHTPTVKTPTTSVGRSPALFQIKSSSGGEGHYQLNNLRHLISRRADLIDPVCNYPKPRLPSAIEMLTLVQQDGAVVTLEDIVIVDDIGRVIDSVGFSEDLVWVHPPARPKPFPLDFVTELWENGRNIENLLETTELTKLFDFNSVPLTYDVKVRTLDSDTWRWIMIWARLFEAFGPFALEPLNAPLAFFWRIYATRKEGKFSIVKYVLGSQEHTPLTMAAVNLKYINLFITHQVREQARRALLLPPLHLELERSIQYATQGQPGLVSLKRHGPTARILPIPPGATNVIGFTEDDARKLKPNTFYRLSWLPVMQTIFNQVEILTRIVYFPTYVPSYVRILFRNNMPSLVILPFHLSFIGAMPLPMVVDMTTSTKSEEPPSEDEDEKDNNAKEGSKRVLRTKETLPSNQELPSTSLDTNVLKCPILGNSPNQLVRVCGLWQGDKEPPFVDPESITYVDEPDLKPHKPEELLELLQFHNMNFSSTVHKEAAKQLLLDFADCFVFTGAPPLSKLPPHYIDTGMFPPVHQHLRRFSPEKDFQIKTIVDELLKHGIIRPSRSPWASPPHLVKNKDGTFRLTIDYKKLNDVTTKDRFPLPRVADVIDSLAGKSIFSTMDLLKGYWAVPIAENDIAKTAFLTRDGLFEWTRMPFGLCNAPATFQRCVNSVFAGLLWISLTVYIDDIAVGSIDFMSHLRVLREVFLRLRTWGLRMKAQKCKFFQSEIEILGFRISSAGKKPTDRLIKAVLDFPKPQPKNGVKAIQSFLGLINYYACFIPHLARLAFPLRRLTRDQVPWEWGVEQDEAFLSLKTAITTAPLLRLPDNKKPFILYTDACIYGLGAVLHQIWDDLEHPIGYASRTLTKAEAKWPIRDLEALAILWGYEYFGIYLEGSRVLIYTDHQSLKWLFEPTASSRIQRWALKFMEIRHLVEIQYKPGIANPVADALSRAPLSTTGTLMSKVMMKPTVDTCTTNALVPTEFYCHLSSRHVVNHFMLQTRQVLTSLLFARILPISNQLIPIPDTPEFQFLSVAQETYEFYKDIKQALVSMHHRPYEKLVQYARDNFVLVDDILCLKDKTGNNHHRMCIPPSLRAEILYLFHDSPLAGHVGRDKMLQLISQRFYWRAWQKDVAQWVRECPLCQIGKASKTSKFGLLQPKDIRFPWEMVSIDIMGPLPPSKGKQYILTMIDCFTRFCILTPLKTRTATVVADAMFLHLVCTFSVPRAILSDQGPEFESLLFKHLCERLGLKKVRTSTYHPQTNGTAERLHRFIKYTLRAVCDEQPRVWAQLLPHVAFAYNTTPVSGIGFSPFEIVFGRPPTLPIDLLTSNPTLFEEDFYRFNLIITKRLKEMYDLVRKCQTQRNEKAKARYDAKHKPIEYKSGDLALLYRPADAEEQITKLHCPFQGPFKVIKQLDTQLYELTSLEDETYRTRANVKNMRPYFPRMLYQDFSSDDEDESDFQESFPDDENDREITLRERHDAQFEEKYPIISRPPVSSINESKNADENAPRGESKQNSEPDSPRIVQADSKVPSDSDEVEDVPRRQLPVRAARPKPTPVRQRKQRTKRVRLAVEPEEEVIAFTEPYGLPLVPFFPEELLQQFVVVQDMQSEDRRPYVGHITAVSENKRIATVWLYGPRQHWSGGLKNLFKWVWYPAYVDLKDNKAVFSLKPLLGRKQPWYLEATFKDVVSVPFMLTEQFKIPRGTKVEVRSYSHPPRLE